jgi:hypothetical protein
MGLEQIPPAPHHSYRCHDGYALLDGEETEISVRYKDVPHEQGPETRNDGKTNNVYEPNVEQTTCADKHKGHSEAFVDRPDYPDKPRADLVHPGGGGAAYNDSENELVEKKILTILHYVRKYH